MAGILLLDTSDAESVAAVSVGGAVLAARKHTGARDGAAMLNFLVRDALADAGMAFADLDAVSVVAGPGSYTGVRVAVSAAKGFCFALGLPLIGHNKLDLLAGNARKSATVEADFIICALPARASEWFVGVYSSENDPMLSPKHVSEAELIGIIKNLGGSILWTGSIPPPGVFQPEIISNEGSMVDLETWSLIANERLTEKHFDDISFFAPFYLKAPFVTVPGMAAP